ncbi:unnamed protein product [Hermetia illucens]|uniref:TMC domain-containing protein n=1 Tax=Hermetia illucens TaxID=343691 RepID=A0A7R8Z018_HERIL|nr:transmembrane channel-like protein 5 [Hermetia illucens]CAD7091086.1 unnamed protein product [Hermetia illucens]
MSHQGHVNAVFNADLDRIEVAHSSTSDLHSTGSQSFLTDSHTNFRFTRAESPDGSRVGTPSNMVRRWSQNLSKFGKGKKSIREKTIYRLPSRKIFQVDGQLLAQSDLEVDDLANEIEQHEYLMQDSVTGEQLRMDTIRALPHSLATKRQIKERLSVSITQHAQQETSTVFKRTKNKTMKAVVHFWNNATSFIGGLELWYGSMKQIEGHFGSGVGTYFVFLRWLFLLNLYLLLFTFAFITLPQITYNAIEKEESTLGNTSSDRVWDVLTGEGFMKHSILFYGAYANETFKITPPKYYSLPHAYFMTMLCLYISTFVIISSSMARSYRRSFIETSGGIRHMYTHKIFCAWDFGISNSKAAQLKHLSIANELREILQMINNTEIKLTKLQRFWIACTRTTAHLLVFGMIIGLGVGMWMLLQELANEGDTSTWTTLYLPLSVNITMIILQNVFSWIAHMEDYNTPQRTLHVTLFRNFLLEAVIVGVLVYFWLQKAHSECWETSIGQEIYRLILMDFIISILGTSAVQACQGLLNLKYPEFIQVPEFDISRKSLGLVYNQTLLWVGLLFAPMIALVVTIKMILTFYIKKLTLIYFCKTPKHVWRSAQTQTLYLVFSFLSLLGVIVAHGYIMTQVPVSKTCGPFRNKHYMFQIFIEGVLALRANHWVWRLIMLLARPAVMGGILLTMSVLVYYLRSKSKARIGMVKLLKEMLYMEAKDKEFLLSCITRITQDKEWLFEDEQVKDERRGRHNYAESSSTWKYERPLRNGATIRSRRI